MNHHDTGPVVSCWLERGVRPTAAMREPSLFRIVWNGCLTLVSLNAVLEAGAAARHVRCTRELDAKCAALANMSVQTYVNC
jgi:hypothetical protein